MIDTTTVLGYSERSKATTFILCILFGEIGVHDIYLGRIGLFIAKALTGNFGGIGYIVDLILIITNRYKDESGRRVASKKLKEKNL